MKIANSDIKSLTDLGGPGNEAFLISDDQIYDTKFNKTLKQAIIDKDYANLQNYSTAISTPSANTYAILTTDDKKAFNHSNAFTTIYTLPTLSSGSYSYTFHHLGIAPTNSTNIVIDSTNNQLYFKRGGTDYTATLTSGTYTFATLATEVGTRMTAQDANSYACTFSNTNRNFTITGTAAFQLRFGAFTSNSSNTVLCYAAEDSASATAQVGYKIDNCIVVRPPSGAAIKVGNNLVENPGYFLLCKRGGSFKLWNLDNTTWAVSGIVAREFRKYNNDEWTPDSSLVGRDTWVSKATGGTARSELTGFSLNGYGYICNGTTGTKTNEVNQYNDSANTWTTKATGGTPRSGLSGFSLNSYGYICDGTTGSVTSAVNQYNDSTNVWASKAGGGTARIGTGGYSLNGYGYICSGGSFTSEVNQYNDSADIWSSKNPTGTNTARTTIAAFSLNGYGYVCYGDSGTASSETAQYNDSANTNTTRAAGGTARLALSGFPLNGYGYVCNGSSGVTYYNLVNQYNDSSNIWITKTTSGTTRNYLSGFSFNGYGYIANGFTGGAAYTNEVNQYN